MEYENNDSIILNSAKMPLFFINKECDVKLIY